jgi:hypothetical protein
LSMLARSAAGGAASGSGYSVPAAPPATPSSTRTVPSCPHSGRPAGPAASRPGSTVETTRSLATFRAMRKLPSSVASRSWPTTLASSSAALGGLGVELAAIQQRQARVRVAGAAVDQRLLRVGVVPVDLWFGRAGVVMPGWKAPPATRLPTHHQRHANHHRGIRGSRPPLHAADDSC